MDLWELRDRLGRLEPLDRLEPRGLPGPWVRQVRRVVLDRKDWRGLRGLRGRLA